MVFSKENSGNIIRSGFPAIAGLIVLLVLFAHMPRPSQAFPLLTTGASTHNIEFKRYCSSSLADVMFHICGGNFNSLLSYNNASGTQKPSAPTNLDSDDDGSNPDLSGPINECCLRPCGYSELKLYCTD